MNKERRAAIAALIKTASAVKEDLALLVGRIEDLKAEAEAIRDEEQEYFDNMPESFQSGEKGQAVEEKLSAMDDAISELDTMIDSLGDDGPLDAFTNGMESAAE